MGVPKEFVFRIPIPSNGGPFRTGVVKMTIDHEAIAQDLGWTAFHNKSKKSMLRGGQIKVQFLRVETLKLGQARKVEE